MAADRRRAAPRRIEGLSRDVARRAHTLAAAERRFRDFYPAGFRDADYVEAERRNKWHAHRRFATELGRAEYAARLAAGAHDEIARTAVRIEATTNLLFSFEKIAIRDAVREPAGAKVFAEGLFDFLYGTGPPASRFDRWRNAVADLPRTKTRVLTWPVLTTFGFLARPRVHLILKPIVTRRAAVAYGFDFRYRPDPRWRTYESLLDFARVLRHDLADWRPRDLIDIQSFIWVLGSSEYD
jgi:hypothetical protein